MGLLIAYTLLSEFFPVVGLVLLLAFFIAMPWIIWRSLKFNMRVTSFSNVRFAFDGKLGGAYFVYLILPILAFLSIYALPIAAVVIVPMFSESSSVGAIGGVLVFALVIGAIVLAFYMFGLLKKKSSEYFINGSRYGQGQFATSLAVAPFVKISLKAFGLFLLMIIAYFLFIVLLSFVLGLSNVLLGTVGNLSEIDNPDVMVALFSDKLVLAIVFLLYFGFVLVGVAAIAYSTTRQREYIYENSKLDEKIAFASIIKARQLMWVMVSNLLLIIFTLGIATPWVKVRIARLFLENTEVDTRIGFDEYVTQKQQEQSSLGDQIGDAFDVEVGIGI